LGSFALNVTLAISKLTIGFFTNSSVIIADGIHSISDIINSILMYASIKLAGKKTKRFPFGLHKLEDFAALFGSIAVMYAGYKIVMTTILSGKHMPINHIYIAVGFLMLVLFSQATFAFFEFKSSKSLNSPGVKTDLLDWLLDMGTTIVAILGIILTYNNIPYAQQIAVGFIVLMIFHGAYGILKDAVLTLLDASVDKETIKQAESIIKSYPEVEDVDMLFIRKAGSILIADAVLRIKEKNVYKAHSIIENIEKDLKKNIEHLKIITIHYEPSKTMHKKRAYFLTKNKEMARKLKDAMYIRVEEIDEKNGVINSTEYENPYYENQKGHFMKLSAWLAKNGIYEIVLDTEEISEDKLKFLKDLGIDVVSK